MTGIVRKAYLVNGSYYLENRYQGFPDPRHAEPSAPNDSQPFLTAVATRAVIFIEAEEPDVGLMCFIAVGMAEVSSCEISVREGQRLSKGDELGMFHFGGSTYCLVFRPGVKLQFHFDLYGTKPGLDATKHTRARKDRDRHRLIRNMRRIARASRRPLPQAQGLALAVLGLAVAPTPQGPQASAAARKLINRCPATCRWQGGANGCGG